MPKLDPPTHGNHCFRFLVLECQFRCLDTDLVVLLSGISGKVICCKCSKAHCYLETSGLYVSSSHSSPLAAVSSSGCLLIAFSIWFPLLQLRVFTCCVMNVCTWEFPPLHLLLLLRVFRGSKSEMDRNLMGTAALPVFSRDGTIQYTVSAISGAVQSNCTHETCRLGLPCIAQGHA